MSAYIDSSAAVKLAAVELETEALLTYLDQLDMQVFSSALLETELRRAVSANKLPQEAASKVLDGIDLVGAPRQSFREAGLLPVAGLRSLDALHLATALRHDAAVMIAYDHRLMAAARELGLPTVSPT